MAVRKIEFTVSTDGIEPAVKQFAGVQGDHKATEVIFNIVPELYRNLTTQATNGARLIYRFDGYDGEGGFKSSDTFELTETTVSYLLEEWLTRFGGVVKVVLVISILKNDLTEMELFNFPALLQLKNSPEGVETDGINRESMSTLAQVAKDSANTAVNAKDIAVEAQEKTELARAALENGTVWVFDGGDATGNVDLDGDGTPDVNTADIKFVVDNEMSDASENAVMNKVVKAYVDDNIEKIGKADYIVEQGTSEIWNYTKWASGKIELWTNNIPFTINWEQVGPLYFSSKSSISVPMVTDIECVNGDSRNWHYANWASVTKNDTVQQAIDIRYYSISDNGNGDTINFSAYIIGRWK